MKASGIVRKVSKLGVIIFPVELRRMLDIDGSSVAFFVDGNSIVLKKYEPTACVFCDSAKDVAAYKGKYVCSGCMEELKG